MNLGQPDKVPDFDNSNCVTDETEISEMMSKVTIQMTMVSKYFAPNDYFSSGKINYRQESSMVGNLSDDPSKAISLFMMGMRK